LGWVGSHEMDPWTTLTRRNGNGHDRGMKNVAITL